MSVSIVVGGQYGSESKGKVVSLLAKAVGVNCAVVRCGGPNSGHIVVEHGKEYCFRLLPAGVVYGRRGFLAPAMALDLTVLKREIDTYQVGPDLLTVDPFSVVITEEMKTAEVPLVSAISSTGSGTGVATAAKCLRNPAPALIKDILGEHEWLRPYVRDVRGEVNNLIDDGHRVIVEGTQGFGLSLHHSRMYPQTTSKDTTAAQFCMEAGLSPLLVDEVVLVVRTFPIRVAGEQAGPLKNEITWEKLQEEAGFPHGLTEVTTVTRKRRRVARFDPDVVKDACQVNRPTAIAVHGLDYLGFENQGKRHFGELNKQAQEFLENLRELTGVPIKYCFTGRSNSDVIADVDSEIGTTDPKVSWQLKKVA